MGAEGFAAVGQPAGTAEAVAPAVAFAENSEPEMQRLTVALLLNLPKFNCTAVIGLSVEVPELAEPLVLASTVPPEELVGPEQF